MGSVREPVVEVLQHRLDVAAGRGIETLSLHERRNALGLSDLCSSGVPLWYCVASEPAICDGFLVRIGDGPEESIRLVDRSHGGPGLSRIAIAHELDERG